MTTTIDQPFPKFPAFVADLASATPEQYLGVPNSIIADKPAFNEIQSYLVAYYSGVTPAHSFADANGSVFDCIPVAQQISLRRKPARLPKAPDLPRRGGLHQEWPSPAKPITQLNRHLRDSLGNTMAAPRGTIPVQRLTLDTLAGFRNLAEFLVRKPRVANNSRLPRVRDVQAEALTPVHKYAYGYELVDTLGGGSTLNLWDPIVGFGQNMSLSQQWYTAGDDDATQTVEIGWQANPNRYGNTLPVLFIFWTADNYITTGCYNLTCSGFVQTSGKWAIGGALAPCSTAGGPQTELAMSTLLDQDKWWVYIGGETSAHAIGYYPASIFNGGAMATGATMMLVGGEVAGTTSWPPMGSGALDSAKWRYAAYQRQVRSFPDIGASRDADLTTTVSAGNCYGASKTNGPAPWGETIWFGGAGGANC